jgi:signal transduction histidine kinase
LLTAITVARSVIAIRVLDTDGAATKRLTMHVASRLQAEAAALAARWRVQGRSVAPGSPTLEPDAERPTQVVRAVDALARALVADPCWQDDIIRAGWALGAEEHRLGASLHALLKQIDLLEAMALYAIEMSLVGNEEDAAPAGVANVPPNAPIAAALVRDEASAADGIALARRLQRARALLSVAAVKGFTEEYLGELRSRYRSLRHDLRNPLGTIRTAVSLMEDETIPADMRANPRFRQMVKRNATSIDLMIGRRLGDESTHEEALSWHEVSLAAITRTIRRDLREDANAAEVDIVADENLPSLRLDAVAAELLLRTAIAAVLREAEPQSQIVVALVRRTAQSVVVSVRHDARVPRDSSCERGLVLAAELAERLHGRVWADDVVYVELPVSAPEEREEIARGGEGAH